MTPGSPAEVRTRLEIPGFENIGLRSEYVGGGLSDGEKDFSFWFSLPILRRKDDVHKWIRL